MTEETTGITIEDNVWIAACDGRLADVTRHLKTTHGGNPDAQDENGFSPLMGSASWGHLHVVEELLRMGANPNLRDTDGNISLHHCEYLDCFNALLTAGADPNARNAEGYNALEFKLQALADVRGEEYESEEGDDEEARLESIVGLLEGMGIKSALPSLEDVVMVREDNEENEENGAGKRVRM